MYRLDALVEPELEKYRKNCNFLADELAVFNRRARGETLEQIAEYENMSDSTVKRIVTRIRAKIERLESL